MKGTAQPNLSLQPTGAVRGGSHANRVVLLVAAPDGAQMELIEKV
jgi:hypothetical protein